MINQLKRVRQRFMGATSAITGHPGYQQHKLQYIVRTGLWVGHCVARRPARISLKSGATLVLPPRLLRSGSGGVFVFRDDYEPELRHLDRLVRPGSVFVDGGANLGIFTMSAASLVGASGTVLAFEPAAHAFADLSANVANAPQQNIRIFNAALSDTDGKADLFHTNGGPVGYSLGTLPGVDTDAELVTTTRLDTLVASEGIDRVDVIKLDVEGAEEIALRGAEAVLTKMRPTVIFELAPAAPTTAGSTHRGAWEYLKSLGYRLHRMTESGDIEPIDEPQIGNNVAIAG